MVIQARAILNRKRNVCGWVFGARDVQLGFVVDTGVRGDAIGEPDITANQAMTA